jgi:RNA polymerase sigma-70 factor (ECF subfamily)
MELPNDCGTNESVEDATVHAAAVGDQSALRTIYEVTSNRVFRLMVRMVGQQDADDLTQQTYVRAFTKLDQFSGNSKFETWLYRLATNEALQHLRREKHRRTKELTVESAMDATDHAERDERVAMVQAALNQLAPELRAIFTLREESGLSYQEIAETLDIPEGTVGSRLNRARRELRKLVEGSRE